MGAWVGLYGESIEIAVHDVRNRLQECGLAGGRKNSILGFAYDLFDLGLFVDGFSTQYASDTIRSETSFGAFLEKHGGDAKSASALGRHLPPIEL